MLLPQPLVSRSRPPTRLLLIYAELILKLEKSKCSLDALTTDLSGHEIGQLVHHVRMGSYIKVCSASPFIVVWCEFYSGYDVVSGTYCNAVPHPVVN